MSGQDSFATAAQTFLTRAGYAREHIVSNYEVSFPTTRSAYDRLRLHSVGFSGYPHAMRTACLAVADLQQHPGNPRDVLTALRYLSAPVALFRTQNRVQLWSVRQRLAERPLVDAPENAWVEQFATRAAELSPSNISAAKLGQRQLHFVDADLHRWATQATEESLRDILSQSLALAITKAPCRTREAENTLITLVFQLFASRVLQDKGVIDATDSPSQALRRSREAYPRCFSASIAAPLRQAAEASYKLISDSYNYERVNSDMLGYVYENTLVSSERRGNQGIYYTPQSIASYILDSLPIETIPQSKRYVYDPCCGSGSFLLASFNRLNALLPSTWSAVDRHRYLQERLMGADADAFAVGIARLSLVLADSTNRDGWEIEQRSVIDDWAPLDTPPRIVVTNPPFKEIKGGSRSELSAEILGRIVTSIPSDSLVGIVLPTSVLESSSAANVRKVVLQECNVIEIALFPGGMFESSADTCVWLLRKCRASERQSSVMIRELKGTDVLNRFAISHEFSRSYPANQAIWDTTPHNEFLFSPLSDLWESLSPPRTLSLGEVAAINTGLQVYRDDDHTVSTRKRTGDKPFVNRLIALKPFCFLCEHQAQPYLWIDFDVDRLRRKGFVEMYENPKVLINSNRNPASAWRIVAAIARQPVYFSDNFHGIRPKGNLPLEAIVAVLNSHVANAWLDAHSRKRKLVIETLKQIPFPRFAERDVSQLVDLVGRLETGIARNDDETGGLFYEAAIASTRTAGLLAEIDAIVFRAYGLVADERRRVERFMSVDKRPG